MRRWADKQEIFVYKIISILLLLVIKQYFSNRRKSFINSKKRKNNRKFRDIASRNFFRLNQRTGCAESNLLIILKKETVTIVDYLNPGLDSTSLQVSNFSFGGDRESHQVELILKNIGERGGGVKT